MKKIYWQYTKIARLGVTDHLNNAIQKNIILCNLMSLLLIHLNLIYFIIDFIKFGNPLRSLTTFSLILISLMSLWLNSKHYDLLSRILSSFMYPLLVFLYGIFIKMYMIQPDLIHYVSPRMPLIMFVFFPFLFLDFNREKIYFILTFSLNAAIVIFYDPIHYLLGINMEKFGLHLNNYHVLTQNSITFLINISMGFTFLKIVNALYEKRIHRLNKILQQKNKRIQHQNLEIKSIVDELSAQQEEITFMNNQLENLVKERTQKLKERNMQLSEYAFFNAHKLRAPVATILGLFEVMELEEEKFEKNPILDYLKESVKELDKVVKEMQKTVEEE